MAKLDGATTGTVWVILGRGVSLAASLVTAAILNQRLGLQGWGEYSLAIAIAGIFAVVSELGVANYTTRELATPDVEQSLRPYLPVRVVTLLITGFIAAAVLVVLGPRIGVPSFVGITVLIAQALLVFNQLVVSLLQVRLQLHKAVMSEVLGRVTILLVAYWYVTEPSSLRAAQAFAAGSAVNLLVTAWLARLPSQDIVGPVNWNILRGSAVLGVTTILSVLHFRADTLLLGILTNPAEVGVYSNALKVVEVVIVLPALIYGVFFPRLVTEWAQRSVVTFRKLVVPASVMSVGVAAYIWMVAPAVSRFLTPNETERVAELIRVLSFAFPVLTLGALATHQLLAMREQRKLLWVSLVALVTNIVANILVIPVWGSKGSAWLTFVTEGLAACVVVYLVWRLASTWTLSLPWITCAAFFYAAAFWGYELLLEALSYSQIGSLADLALITLITAGVTGLLLAFYRKHSVHERATA